MDSIIKLKLEKEGFGHSDPYVRDEDSYDVSELIPKILFQRGSFSKLTEDSLRKEIENSIPPSSSEVFSDAEFVSNFPNQLEGTLSVTEDDKNIESSDSWENSKAELVNSLSSALNETSLSLDFVSLLITASKPNLGKTTMSPHLSKTVSLGSLGSDRLHDSDKTISQTNVLSVGHGWKSNAIKSITESFKSASRELSSQIIKEKNYWDSISLIMEHKESLKRGRDPLNGSKEIAINYGFADSGSSYFDGGVALLKKDPRSGEAIFQPINSNKNFSSKTFRYVKVKVLSKIDDDFMLTGQSRFDRKLLNTSKHSIINNIEKARFFLFEEDLFYFLTREAKFLVNYNVSIVGSQIMIEINNEIIQIESVVYDENNEDELENNYQNINEQSSINNNKAQAILVFLKIMLCCFYSYNLKLKQKVPTTLTKWKQSNSHPLVLRSLLGHIRHEIYIKHMLTQLKSIITRNEATVNFDLNYSRYTNLKASEGQHGNPFIKSVERPLSKFTLIASNKTTSEHLLIETILTSNETFCTLVLITDVVKFNSKDHLNANKDGLNILHNNFNDFNDFEESVEWTIFNLVKG